jgi:hypothetical protein
MTLKSSSFGGLKSRVWTGCGIAVICFAAGSLTTGHLVQVTPVKAGSDRVFELRIYHAVPGRLPAMESRFRDTTSKLLVKHNLNVVGYWTSEVGPGSDNAFLFLLAHRNMAEARQNWDAMGKDPEFQQVIKAEQAGKTLEKADVIYMRPTDFSPMK